MRRSRSLPHVFALAGIATAMLLVASTFAVAAPGAVTGRRPAAVTAEPLRPAPFDGKVAPAVLRQLRSGGSADALLILNDGGALAAAEASAPAGPARARVRAILSATRPAYAAGKAAVLDRLLGVRVLRDYDALPIVFARFTSRAQLLAAAADPGVVAVAENEQMEAFLSQSLPLIGQPTAATAGHVGNNTAVAVLDTGVNYTHPAFGSCTSPGVPAGCKVVVAQDFATNDGSLDDNGHGTNVSGIVVGVAPGTKILGLDVFAPTGSASNTDILAAINFAITNQATYNVRAINMSLGVPNDYNVSPCGEATNPYVSAFANARAVNILPVVAAGNDAFSSGSYHIGIARPACTPGAVRVGAVYDANVGGLSWGTPPDQCTDSTTMADQITCFSQTASYLSLLGPGALITAAGITQGGTSQATPHVAGAAAVLSGVNPAASPTGVETALSTTGPLIFDPLISMSFHRLDLPAAIAAVGTAPPPGGPTITSFSPTSGPVGTNVTINGANFTGATSVTFGGVPTSAGEGIVPSAFTVISATQISASVPFGAVTGPIGVSTPAGSATSAGIFTVSTTAPDHLRSVSFFDGGRRAKGRVTVLDGFSACAAGVPLKLQEKRGRWVTVAKGSTSANGAFSATGLELSIKYRVVAPRKILTSGDICLKATSPVLQWWG